MPMFSWPVFVLFFFSHPCHPLPVPSVLHVLHQEQQGATEVEEGESEGQDQVNENRLVSKALIEFINHWTFIQRGYKFTR